MYVCSPRLLTVLLAGCVGLCGWYSYQQYQQVAAHEANSFMTLEPLASISRVMTLAECVAKGPRQAFEYRLHKIVKGPIEFQLASLSCGCMSAELDGQKLEPMTSISWDETTDSSPKVLTVYTNTPKTVSDFQFSFSLVASLKQDRSKSSEVHGKGRLKSVADVVVEPNTQRVNTKAGTKEILFRANVSVKKGQLTHGQPSIEALPQWLDLVSVKALGRADTGEVTQERWQINFRLNSHADSLQASETARVLIRFPAETNETTREAWLTIIASPGGVVCGKEFAMIPGQSLGSHTVSFPIRSLDGVKFRIIKMEHQSDVGGVVVNEPSDTGGDLSIEFDPRKTSDLHMIKVRSVGSGPFRRTLRFTTDHPLCRGVQVTVFHE